MQNEIAVALDEYLKTARDYRDGKISEKELKQTEEKYRATVDMYKWRTD